MEAVQGSTRGIRARRRVWVGAACAAMALLAAPPSSAQEIEGLREAVDYYHEYATSDLQHIHEAVRRLEAIAIKNPVGEGNPDAWLPAYWTAMVYSQLSMFSGDERSKPYVDLAEAYYEKAWSGKPDAGPEMDANFYALKGLIMGFVGGSDPENAEEHRATARQYWSRAHEADPDNPMALMNQGLSLLPDVETRGQAYEILDRAIELYEPRMGTTTPNWGREFIDVWMGSYPRPEPGR